MMCISNRMFHNVQLAVVLQRHVLDNFHDLCNIMFSRALYGLKSETKDAELNIAELKDPKPACECVEVGDGAKSISVHPLQVFNCTQDDVRHQVILSPN